MNVIISGSVHKSPNYYFHYYYYYYYYYSILLLLLLLLKNHFRLRMITVSRWFGGYSIVSGRFQCLFYSLCRVVYPSNCRPFARKGPSHRSIDANPLRKAGFAARSNPKPRSPEPISSDSGPNPEPEDRGNQYRPKRLRPIHAGRDYPAGMI